MKSDLSRIFTKLAKAGYWTTISYDPGKRAYRINCRLTGGEGYSTKYVDAVDYELAQSFDPLERELEKLIDG